MSLLCYLFGHRWELVHLPRLTGVTRGGDGPFDEVISFTGVTAEEEPSKACFRCGTIQKKQ